MTDERKPREWTVEEIWNRVDSFNTGDLPDVLIEKSAFAALEKERDELRKELSGYAQYPSVSALEAGQYLLEKKIAELKRQLDEAQAELAKWRDGKV